MEAGFLICICRAYTETLILGYKMIKLVFLILGYLIVVDSSDRLNRVTVGISFDDNVSQETRDLVFLKLEEYYNMELVLTEKNLFPNEFNRDTINAMKLIVYIEENSSLPFKKNIFFTEKGIALSDDADYSIRGLTRTGGSISIVSSLVVKHESSTILEFEERLGKVLIHEMGHLFGLLHCVDYDRCVMVSTLHGPELLYNAEKKLCPSCLDKIDKTLVKEEYH
jgi:predicted Zn-dependent protease